MIRFKAGVPEHGLHERLNAEVLPALDRTFAWFGLDAVVTSTSDGKHKFSSKHYLKPCQAVDVRTRHMASESDKEVALVMLRHALGSDYDVLYEYPGQPNQHFHVELDVKG